jgi:hypothetical protein
MNIQVYTLPEALNGLGSLSQPRTSIDLNFNFQSAFCHIFRGSLSTYQFTPRTARGSVNLFAQQNRSQNNDRTAAKTPLNPTLYNSINSAILRRMRILIGQPPERKPKTA